MPYIKKVYVTTTTSIDFSPLTHDIHAAIKDAGAANGVVHVVVSKGGAGLMVFENLPEVREAVTAYLESIAQDGDIQDKLRRAVALAPRVQAAMLQRSVALPFVEGTLVLAAYEEIILVDCEDRVQRREVIIAITAEESRADDS